MNYAYRAAALGESRDNSKYPLDYKHLLYNIYLL
jgi:hypothetical protein